MDELMIRWAEELHGPDANVMQGAGCSTLARLIDSKGTVMSRTYGSVNLGSVSADIEIIVNKHLPPELERIAWVHYTDHDSPNSMKWERCACGRSQYYRRLRQLQDAVAELLVARRRAAA